MLKRNDVAAFAVTACALVATAVLRYSHAGAIATFVAVAVALSLLAMHVSRATEEVGGHLNPGATGLLQAALGNLPELLVCLFSLRAGLVRVVQATLVGSILANSLLVLGTAIMVGGAKHGRLRFDAEAPRMIATLMLLAVAALSLPTLAAVLHTPAAAHESALSVACAVVLLVVFAASLPFSLNRDPAASVRHAESAAAGDAWPLGIAVAVLVVASLAAALASDWFVDALMPAIGALHISQEFAGIVLVAIAGNAVENVAGIRLAAKNRPDYAMSVILNSSLLIALAVTPALVLLSHVAGGPVLTLVMPPLLIAALLLTTLTSAIIVNDGETIWLEGAALIGLYGIIAATFWWG